MLDMDREPLPGIVLVSHSAAIAEGLAAMAAEVAGGEVRIVAAGGGPGGTLGTDGGRVADAVREADAGAGVVILADIGSAVLSVRAVLNDGMADGAVAVLADAPLVEGAIAAAVTASVGGDYEAVRSAAEDAWNVRKL
jgi:phosphoenolpyruvate---glycerone phosphotransferase subunit DhaM